jgi:hypothetical protein
MFYSSHIGLSCLCLTLFMYLIWNLYFCLIPHIYYHLIYVLLLTCSVSCLLFLLWMYGMFNKERQNMAWPGYELKDGPA